MKKSEDWEKKFDEILYSTGVSEDCEHYSPLCRKEDHVGELCGCEVAQVWNNAKAFIKANFIPKSVTEEHDT